MAILFMIYQGRHCKKEGSDCLLLDALKCSLYSPGIMLNSIKGAPISQNSNQMKALLACFFEAMTNQQSNLGADAFKIAETVLQENEHLLACFILFFRCILAALEIEGASIWKGSMNGFTCI